MLIVLLRLWHGWREERGTGLEEMSKTRVRYTEEPAQNGEKIRKR